MSTPNVIASVTWLLRDLLQQYVEPEFKLEDITALPLDKARGGETSSKRLNFFLYQLVPNAAWQSVTVKRGESAYPQLALNLRYLLTAYSPEDDRQAAAADTFLDSQMFLGSAMRVLHDHPTLVIKDVKQKPNLGRELEQIENIRITPLGLTVEELSKLWTMFQTQYRTSVAYEVGVALIDSQRSMRTPAPVLARGDYNERAGRDQGADVSAGVLPTLSKVRTIDPNAAEKYLAEARVVLRPTDRLAFFGTGFSGEKTEIEVTHARLGDSVRVVPSHHTVERDGTERLELDYATVLAALIPKTKAELMAQGESEHEAELHAAERAVSAGVYTAAVWVTRGELGKERTLPSNVLTFAVPPQLTLADHFVTIHQVNGAPNTEHIVVQFISAPPIRVGQRVSALFGDQEILFAPGALNTEPFTFTVKNPTRGKYLVRLRVDGADTIADLPAEADPNQPGQMLPPRFDEDYQVTVQ